MEGLLPTVLLDFRTAHFIPEINFQNLSDLPTCNSKAKTKGKWVNIPQTSLLLNSWCKLPFSIKYSPCALWDDDKS